MDRREIDLAIAGAKDRFDHAEASHDPDVLALIRAAEALRAELDAIGGMRFVEHDGYTLKVITVALHDRLCRARVATPQEGTDPEVSHCAFCGFSYPRIVPAEV